MESLGFVVRVLRVGIRGRRMHCEVSREAVGGWHQTMVEVVTGSIGG